MKGITVRAGQQRQAWQRLAKVIYAVLVRDTSTVPVAAHAPSRAVENDRPSSPLPFLATMETDALSKPRAATFHFRSLPHNLPVVAFFCARSTPDTLQEECQLVGEQIDAAGPLKEDGRQ